MDAEIIQLRFRWPILMPSKLAENFYLGVWHPHKTVQVDWEQAPKAMGLVSTNESNWFLLSSVSPLHPGSPSLIHRTADQQTTIAFRGYLLDPPFHSYSAHKTIVRYWSQSAVVEHNGVFSVAIIQQGGKNLCLLTDAFGFGPLYFRRWNGMVLFSSNSRFLRLNDDEPDLIAWRELLEAGFIASDRTLSSQIQRLPAGMMLSGSSTGVEVKPWFDFDQLPYGRRPVDRHALGDVEDAFQTAMTRCLRLNNDAISLPLSSGHDSRRILATLVNRKIDFKAFTVRVRQKGYRDLDAVYAAAMAQDFGFPHTVIELGDALSYVENDIDKRVLVDAETTAHSWAIRLMESLPTKPSIVLDGIVGDILGNPGFRMPGLYQSQEQDLALITQECIKAAAYDSILPASKWPSAESLREDIKHYLKPFMQRPNMAEFAFILLRQRRSTALWSQQLLPAGHVVVCPYLDLNYITLLLEFIPAQKHQTIFQRRCLQEFWPQYAQYPGNRDIPPGLPENRPDRETEYNLQCYYQLLREIRAYSADGFLKSLLTTKAKIAFMLARHNHYAAQHAAQRAHWFLGPIMQLVVRQTSNQGCWSVLR